MGLVEAEILDARGMGNNTLKAHFTAVETALGLKAADAALTTLRTRVGIMNGGTAGVSATLNPIATGLALEKISNEQISL